MRTAVITPATNTERSHDTSTALNKAQPHPAAAAVQPTPQVGRPISGAGSQGSCMRGEQGVQLPSVTPHALVDWLQRFHASKPLPLQAISSAIGCLHASPELHEQRKAYCHCDSITMQLV